MKHLRISSYVLCALLAACASARLERATASHFVSTGLTP